MEKKNDIRFCLLVDSLKQAAEGKQTDKDHLIAELLDIGQTGFGESLDYRLLDALQKADGDKNKDVCRGILSLICDGTPEDYSLTDAFSRNYLITKRAELAALKKTVRRLEAIERVKELTEMKRKYNRLIEEEEDELKRLKEWLAAPEGTVYPNSDIDDD